MAAAVDLAAVLVRIGRAIEGAERLDDMLGTIVSSACFCVPGFDLAGISAFDDSGAVSTLAATHDVVRDLDSLQARLGEGPGITALHESQTVTAPRLSSDRRWPKYAREAVTNHGIVCLLALPLRVEDQAIGVLAVYSTTQPDVHPDASAFAEVLASQAAVAIGHDREVAQLKRALDTSRTIGTAIGILMQRHHLDRAGAFRRLSQASQDSNVRLRDIAAEVVFRTETGSS